MAPSTPRPRQGPAPSAPVVNNQQRSPLHRTIQSSMKRPEGTAPGAPLTPAEAYASAHTSKRDKENVQAAAAHPPIPSTRTKPLFGWITRKLGAGRRATYSDGSSPAPIPPRSRPQREGKFVHGSGTAKENDVRNMSPGMIFGTAVTRDNSVTRTESHSLRSYSVSYANSTERRTSADRRIANNPYPSIPVSMLHRASVVDTISESFFSRSRTPSLQSERSRPVRSLYDVDDVSSRWMNSRGADEDASIRPFPPSHPSSPTPSQSVLSRSASASLLSPISQVQRPSSYFSRTHQSVSTSTGSSELDLPEGRQSRQDSTSTKPTILSFDSNQHVAHIAQVQSSAPSNSQQHASITHDHSLPGSILAAGSTPPAVSPDSPADTGAEQTPVSPQDGFPASSAPSSPSRASLQHAQAPKHSQPHPRDNPRPSSTPEPNASTLTLASSTFAMIPPHAASTTPPTGPVYPSTTASRLREVTTVPQPNTTNRHTLSTSPSVTFASEANRPSSTHDSASVHQPASVSGFSYGPSVGNMSIRTGGWRSAADGDASVRALRRNGSWESDRSVWSWREQKYGGSSAFSNAPASRLSAYTNEEDPGSTFYFNPGSVQRDSFITAQSKLSRGSHGWTEGDEDETPGMDNKQFELERAATPITA